jgi:hypothetical protein
MKDIPWQLIQPMIFVLLGLIIVIAIAIWPEAKDGGMLLLGGVLTRIKIPNGTTNK